MATLTLPFNHDPQLTGVQVGDTVYTVDSSAVVGTFATTSNLNNVIELGVITSFSGTYEINVDLLSTVTVNQIPSSGDYIFFSKDNAVNLASLKGYYAEVKFVNNSTDRAELFNVGLGVEVSSK